MIQTVPIDKTYFPTLGPQVCDFIEQKLVFGPGDLRGEPAVLDDEKRGLIYRMYEVFPKGHPNAGRRRFKRVGLSLPKGLGKTELAAWIAACELHPEGPVRCVGWTKKGEPIGGPVTDPYIPMVAVTEGQSDELAYGALKMMIDEGPMSADFDTGLERIMRIDGSGKAASLATSPSSRDGARTTFAIGDETHHWTSDRMKKAHQTMLANLAKRKISDPWMLEITTAPEPGTGSVAELMMDYADAVADGRVKDASLFFFHQQASDDHDLTTKDGARAAVIEASGIAAAWRDIDAIVDMWNDPTTDRAWWERVWCNRLVKGALQAFDTQKWDALERPFTPKYGALITVGFDGAVFFDSTGIVCTDVETGDQWVPGVWERPSHLRPEEHWEVPLDEVDMCMRAVFAQFNVWRLYADPPYWQSHIAAWRRDFGEERVIDWYTNRRNQMSSSLENFDSAIKTGLNHHNGDKRLARHIGNSRRQDLPMKDDQGKPLWLIRKERPDSPKKIDLAMASVLSWEARTDAISQGAKVETKQFQVMVYGGKR